MDGPDRDTLTRAVGDCASAITVFDKSSNIDVYRSVACIVFCNAGSVNPSVGSNGILCAGKPADGSQ